MNEYVSTGYSTGSIIKQQKDRRDYIDDFYSTHAPSTGAVGDFIVATSDSEGVAPNDNSAAQQGDGGAYADELASHD